MTSRTIAITGATGFIGERLTEALQARGDAVIALTRDRARAAQELPPARYPGLRVVEYSPDRLGDWVGALEGADAVVHLAGAPINGRWTPEFKKAILDSRKQGTHALVEALAALSRRPEALISASAARYYGTSETALFDEDSPPGPISDYLSFVCRHWENEALRAKTLGMRVAVARFGFALAMGTTFKKALPVLGRFMGGRVGTGRQWVSWIHRDDIAQALIRLIDDPALDGPFNLTAPNPVRMRDFSATMAQVTGGKTPLPVPGAVIRQFLGDGATVILDGQQVAPKRLTEAGFAFSHPDLRPALATIL
ncbi:MAG: TIGR01777 family oxidoreductase [Rubrimonas sp.]|uniref:TIGR01777 family oxidoreductase n=1 Tax=Rubrimonas sp. TaxID=2036015 RepID=UPI002FDC8D45